MHVQVFLEMVFLEIEMETMGVQVFFLGPIYGLIMGVQILSRNG
jgi:hypothetical protein